MRCSGGSRTCIRDVLYVPCRFVVLPLAVLHDEVLMVWRDEAGNDQVLELDLQTVGGTSPRVGCLQGKNAGNDPSFHVEASANEGQHTL